MDKIKRYIDCYVPVTNCNLRCSYCYITTHRLFGGPLPTFKYSPSHIKKALSKQRLGGSCLFNMCAGGETLLFPQLYDYVIALLEEGHYVMIVTNATLTQRLQKFANMPGALKDRLFFKFSYHYTQLKQKNILDVFFANVKMIRDSGCSFTVELTPSDDQIPYITEIKNKVFEELGAPCHCTIARDERDDNVLPILTSLKKEDYIDTWKVFDSPLFDYKLDLFGVKRTEFCYAGDWSAYLNFATGEMRQCYKSYVSWNVFENIDNPIPFCAIGHSCHEHHCYNGHSFVSLGVIPSLKAPIYSSFRNRTCVDGSEWLTPAMNSFMSSKLYDTNREYDVLKCFMIDIKNVYFFVVYKVNKRLKKIFH